MRNIVNQLEVSELKILYVFNVRINLKLWEWKRESLQLLLQWLDVILVYMRISEAVNKLTSSEPAYLSKCTRQQCVAGNVEGNSQPHITGALVHLAGETTISGYVELGQDVAGR